MVRVLDAFNQELDIDSFIDFEMNPEGFITRSMEMDDVSVNRYSCSELNKDHIVVTSDNKSTTRMLYQESCLCAMKKWIWIKSSIM